MTITNNFLVMMTIHLATDGPEPQTDPNLFKVFGELLGSTFQ